MRINCLKSSLTSNFHVPASSARCYSPLITADVPRLTMWKHLLDRVRQLLEEIMDVPYVSVPVWRPWRDF